MCKHLLLQMWPFHNFFQTFLHASIQPYHTDRTPLQKLTVWPSVMLSLKPICPCQKSPSSQSSGLALRLFSQSCQFPGPVELLLQTWQNKSYACENIQHHKCSRKQRWTSIVFTWIMCPANTWKQYLAWKADVIKNTFICVLNTLGGPKNVERHVFWGGVKIFGRTTPLKL